jgi:hypothetical protein
MMRPMMKRQEWLKIQEEARGDAANPQTHNAKTSSVTVILLAEILEQLWLANQRDAKKDD